MEPGRQEVPGPHRRLSNLGPAGDLEVIAFERRHTLARGLELRLRAPGLRVTGTPETAAEAERMIVTRRPHVALLAASIPDAGALTRRVLAQWPAARILVHVDGLASEALIRDGFEAGIAGFVSRDGTAADLLGALRAVADGSRYLDSRLATAAGRAAPPPRLTRRHREILDLLAAGMTSEEIAERLVLSRYTVDTHVRNLMARIGANSRVHALALAIQTREIEVLQP
jgi:DNA-binding NarL/FixJ family response regulator